jgi:hypothetical protein
MIAHVAQCKALPRTMRLVGAWAMQTRVSVKAPRRLCHRSPAIAFSTLALNGLTIMLSQFLRSDLLR